MALQGWRERWAGARSWLDHAGPCAPSGLGVLERSSGPHLRARTLASVGGWTEGARTRAGKESLGLGWVGQQTPFLSRVSPDSAGAPPLQDLPAASSSPRAPRAGGGARRRGALPGWSPAPVPPPHPAAPLPSSESGRAAPGNLPAAQPMGGRSRDPLPFSGTPAAASAVLRPPRAAPGVAGR